MTATGWQMFVAEIKQRYNRLVLLFTGLPNHTLFVIGANMRPQASSEPRGVPRSVVLIVTVMAFGLVPIPRPLPAQTTNDDQDAQPNPQDENPKHKLRLKVMSQRATETRPWLLKNGERITLAAHEEPLFRLVDPTRKYPDGTIWVWPRTGRPAAILTFSIMASSNRWLYEFVSLSEQPVGAAAGPVFWSCKQSGWNPLTLPDSPAPATEERERLRQMRMLARRFTAVELLPPPMRYELRLLPQPLLRYSDPDSMQLDGAIFMFCHGTNPEILLIIEAKQKADKTAQWQYGFAPNTIAELRVELDGKEVWNRPHISFADASSDEPYFIAVDSFKAHELEAVEP